MSARPFEQGLSEVADGVFAYLQPHGGWGLSNAGLVVSGGQSLLVDTLFDRAHTERMLDAMRRSAKAARDIDVVVNTHANGDHCYGNELVAGARIVASSAAADEMRTMTPAKLASLMKVTRIGAALGPVRPMLTRMLNAVGLKTEASILDASEFVQRVFGRFDFDGIELVVPQETFSGRVELEVEERTVELLEVGPAHTRGDVLAFVPDAKVVFTGDILFADAHPLLWEGPVSNWIAACDEILSRDITTVVPGHGPIGNLTAVEKMRAYLVWVLDESTQRFEAGMGEEEAARDIELAPFADWSEPERIAVNVAACYRELRKSREEANVIELFGRMARWDRDLG